MKKVLYALSVILMISCQSSTTNEVEAKNENGKQNKAEHHHHDEPLKVSLNDGKRWKANLETTQGIANMQELVSTFSTDKASYNQLHMELVEEFKLIFKRCTMKGEAHDQLHNYLIPLKGMIDNISDDNIREIQDYLATYSTYFK